MPIARRSLLAGAGSAALPLFAIKQARAADFTYRFGNDLPPAHPMNVRSEEACQRIAEATNGQLQIKMYPDNKLGSDTVMLAKVRAGEIDLIQLPGSVLSAVVPQSSIGGTGFVFKNYTEVWAAMDGKVGQFIRAEAVKQGLNVVGPLWNNGFRQITNNVKAVRSPDDMLGLKLRVPPSAMSASIFKILGAEAVLLNFSDTYAAMQAHSVDGQENPLAIIQVSKLYEVQNFCSMTNHMWDAYWPLFNSAAWLRLPSRFRDIVEAEFSRSAADERNDLILSSPNIRGDLVTAGLSINAVDATLFKGKLQKAGFYKEWRDKFGDPAWTLLQDVVGALS